MSFEIVADELVEGQEVINFTLSDANIHNLDNKRAAVSGSIKSLLVVIIDDDGEYILSYIRDRVLLMCIHNFHGRDSHCQKLK